MLLGSIQLCGQKVSTLEVNDLCQSLDANAVRLLSLRRCTMADQDFEHLCTSVGHSKAILQLNLNLGLVKNLDRVHQLSSALCKNRSLTSLFLHGSPLGDKGAALLCQALSLHPGVVSLDLGDCKLTDASILPISDLLPPNGAKRGLEALTLSANQGITPEGWAKFFVAMAASSNLRSLSLDYTRLGDGGASCLAVALAARNSVQMVDIEGCGISEVGARVILHLLENFPTRITQLIVADNKAQPRTVKAIKVCVKENKLEGNINNNNEVTKSQDQPQEDATASESSDEEDDEELGKISVSPGERHMKVAASPRALVPQVPHPNVSWGKPIVTKSNQRTTKVPTDSWESTSPPRNSLSSSKGSISAGQAKSAFSGGSESVLRTSGSDEQKTVLRTSGSDMNDLAFSGSPGGSTSLHLSQAYQELLRSQP